MIVQILKNILAWLWRFEPVWSEDSNRKHGRDGWHCSGTLNGQPCRHDTAANTHWQPCHTTASHPVHFRHSYNRHSLSIFSLSVLFVFSFSDVCQLTYCQPHHHRCSYCDQQNIISRCLNTKCTAPEMFKNSEDRRPKTVK